jgi:hypothetical protein
MRNDTYENITCLKNTYTPHVTEARNLPASSSGQGTKSKKQAFQAP